MRSRPWFVLSFLLSASSVAWAAPPTWGPKSTHALLVGILEWKNKQFASFPKKNRQDRELERALIAAGVPRSNIVFLMDREATYDGIKREWTAMASRAGEDSTLLFYFTGHGGATAGEIYLCDYDAKPDCVGDSMNVEEIGDILRKKKWAGDRLILMGDTCYSGGMARVVRSFEGHERMDDDFFYFIQYDDLSAAWSEWVTADRMRPIGGRKR